MPKIERKPARGLQEKKDRDFPRGVSLNPAYGSGACCIRWFWAAPGKLGMADEVFALECFCAAGGDADRIDRRSSVELGLFV